MLDSRRRSAHRPLGFLFAILFAANVGLAQPVVADDITVRASVDNPRVRVGESITLSIEVDGAQSVDAPTLGALDGFAARYVGPSQQVSIVNGQISARVQHRYALTAQRDGQFTLGPFEVSYDGKTYETNTLQLRVSPAAAAPHPPDGGAVGDAEPLRLTLEVARPRVYLHQRVPVDATLYVGAVTARDLQYPNLPAEGVSIEGFGQPVRSAQVIDGQRFEVLRFRSSVTPLKTGRLQLGPARTSLNVVRRPQNFFFTQRQPVELTSNAVTLEVLPLPVAGRPADFSGAVGAFSLDVSAAPTQVRAGDPITVRITLRGDGNLAQLQAPTFAGGGGFKVYDPQAVDGGGDLARVFEQVVIPEHPGVDRLPALQFSYFDPDAEEYRSTQSAPIPLMVEAAERDAERQIVSATGVDQRKDPETIGRDIVYIKDEPGALVRSDELAMRWWILLLWQPVPIFLYVGVILYDRRRRRLSGDERFARATRAGRAARTALGNAQAALDAGDTAAFHDRLAAALRDYLSAKLGLPPGAIDRERLHSAGIGDEMVERVTAVLAACEQVRFAPITGTADQRQLLDGTRTIVRDMERDRSLRPV